MKRLFVIFACLTFMLTGCSSQKKANLQEKKIEVDKNIQKFGEKSTSSIELKIKNETGQNIVNFQIANDVDNEFSENILEDKKIRKDETIIVYTELSNDTLDQKADEMMIETRYLILFELDDGSIFTLHNLNFETIKEFSIVVDEKIAYITFENEDGKIVDTKEEEKAQIQVEKEAEKKEQEPEIQPEPEYVPQEVPVQEYQPEYIPQPDYSYDTSYGDTSSGGDSEGCLDGVF